MTSAQPVLINEPRPPDLRTTLAELWRSRELILELSKRSIQLRYKNSVLGVAWSLLTPLMFAFVIVVVRKYLLGIRIDNYSAFVLPVLFAWTFFAMAIPDCCTVLLEHAAMIRKIYFPRELLPLTVVVANLVHLLIALGVALAYLIYHRIVPWQVNWELLLLLLIIPAQCCVILGVGLVVSALNVLFEDVRYIVTVLMQVLFYAVPILYLVENVARAAGEPWGQPLLDAWLRPHLLELYLLNPFAAILVLYQKAMLPPVVAEGLTPLPWSWGLLGQTWLIAGLLLWFGVWVFHKAKWTVVERL